MNPQCSQCYLFFSWDTKYDEYTHFGNYGDLEPLDPCFLCEKCAEEYLKSMLKRGIPYHPWIPGWTHKKAAELLGFVEAGPKGAAWADYFRPNEIPTGYVVWKQN